MNIILEVIKKKKDSYRIRNRDKDKREKYGNKGNEFMGSNACSGIKRINGIPKYDYTF